MEALRGHLSDLSNYWACDAYYSFECVKRNPVLFKKGKKESIMSQNNSSQENQAKIDRAMELRSELFEIANSFAGDETGDVAVMLHESCNCIFRAKEVLATPKIRKTL